MNTPDTPSPGHWKRPLITGAVLLLILGALIVLLPGWLHTPVPEGIKLVPPACDLSRGPCRLEQEGIALEFSLGPAPIQSLTTLKAELNLKGIDAQRVQLSLEGRDMYMGLNQTELTPTADAGHWSGSTELAACTTGRMVWRARLLLESKQQQYVTWFDFEAQ